MLWCMRIIKFTEDEYRYLISHLDMMLDDRTWLGSKYVGNIQNYGKAPLALAFVLDKLRKTEKDGERKTWMS